MRRVLTLLLFIVPTVPLLAHHNASLTYNADMPVPLAGTITAVEWKNPHVLVYLDAKDATGAVVNWKVELVGRRDGMNTQGLSRDNLRVGHPISMTACLAKDGSHTAAAQALSVPSTMAYKRVGLC